MGRILSWSNEPMSSFTAKDPPNQISRGHFQVNLTLCKKNLEQENDLVKNSTNFLVDELKSRRDRAEEMWKWKR